MERNLEVELPREEPGFVISDLPKCQVQSSLSESNPGAPNGVFFFNIYILLHRLSGRPEIYYTGIFVSSCRYLVMHEEAPMELPLDRLGLL